MRYCVFGDIHGNLQALDAVLEHAASEHAETYLCLGDIVGYGADPCRCLERVRGLTDHVVAGNHDCAVVGRADVQYFNPFAREAAYWTASQLSEDQKQYIRDLPLVRIVDGMTLVHATAHNPEVFGYIESALAARLSFEALTTPMCFVGHSHVPVTFYYEDATDEIWYSQDPEIPLGNFSRIIINCGSVGQPRDENPMAAYVLYDSDLHKATLHRVAYDIEAARQSILDAGLPDILADRLRRGQ